MNPDADALAPRVYLVDDEQAVRDSLAKILRREGHEVVAAADGDEGLRVWRERGAAVVILDIHMPKSDGIETLVQLRALRPSLPVIFTMTASLSSRL